MGSGKQLILFSLDVLVDVPALYTNALMRIFGRGLSERRVLSLLAERRLNVYNVIRVACEHTDLEYGEAVQRFDTTVHNGAFGCVKEDAHNLYRLQSDLGVFYTLKESALCKVVANTKLPIVTSAGLEGKEDTGDLIEKAFLRSNAAKVKLATGSTIIIPEGIEERLKVPVDYFRTSQVSLDAITE